MLVAVGMAVGLATIAGSGGSLTAAGIIWLILLGLFLIRGRDFDVVFGLGLATSLLTQAFPDGWIQWAVAPVVAVGLTWLLADEPNDDAAGA
ncbi:hypothetical protein LRS13_18025 [Svornostia abyssi]|uniref:Uncharacterized protein n=1 Tax=Svornostia abyssi TaxID=2898438 RepID=A0ABY5PDI8_9ACTN|nr:hypothetical protein LRS13_18025 [Parviterribacteraceae bacterium J379]